MTLKSGVGMSNNRNPKDAARQAAEQALARAGTQEPDFVLLFASVGYSQQVVLDEVRAVTGAPVCGCSAEGVIAGTDAQESNFCVAVMALKSDELRVRHGIATELKADPQSAGRSIGQAIAKDMPDNPIALLIFPDGMTMNFDKMAAGIESSLPDGISIPMLGGTASDNLKFERTYQYCDDRVVSDGISWALLHGPTRVTYGVNHGCIPVGVEHTVTRSDGNVIYEIDGRPAVEVLRDYMSQVELDDWMKVVMTLSLGLKAPRQFGADYDQFVIRTLVGGLDAESGSVTVADAVDEGSSVWVTRRDYDKMAEGVERTCNDILTDLDGTPPQLVFHFDCVGRGKSFLREQQKRDLLGNLRERLGDAPWVGFYCYGEISPVCGKNAFHNLTMVLAALY